MSLLDRFEPVLSREERGMSPMPEPLTMFVCETGDESHHDGVPCRCHDRLRHSVCGKVVRDCRCFS